MTKQFPQDIKEPVILPFSIDNFGLYALKITARCQSGLKNNQDQDLRIEIDGMKFREIPPQDKAQYNNIPPAWNGSQLKGLNKTIFFILALNKGPHEVTLIPTNGAYVISFEVKPINDLQNIVFEIGEKAKERDRQPWYAFAFINLPLQIIIADVSVSWHFLDGDDIKLIVDNQIEKNVNSKLWKNWVWSARPWYILSGAKREQKTFTKNLPTGIHYVEFWADKTPVLHQIIFDLGAVQLERVPSVNDPIWTGDFNDDTDQMLLARLILGEMEGQSEEAKTGVGFTVLNRLKKKRSNWGASIKEIILKKKQYDAFVNKLTAKKVQDPLSHVSEKEWKDCYKIAEQLLAGTLSDPTFGATHFYSTSDGRDFPSWATGDVFKTKIGITFFYELES